MNVCPFPLSDASDKPQGPENRQQRAKEGPWATARQPQDSGQLPYCCELTARGVSTVSLKEALCRWHWTRAAGQPQQQAKGSEPQGAAQAAAWWGPTWLSAGHSEWYSINLGGLSKSLRNQLLVAGKNVASSVAFLVASRISP